MSNVRKLFAAQKAAKLQQQTSTPTKSSSSSPASSSSSSPKATVATTTAKRIQHRLAQYDPLTLKLNCAICGPAVIIKSDSLWNAHLVSKVHHDAVAKLRAMKEKMVAEQEEAARLKAVQAQQRQQQQQQQGVKRGGLVAYAGSDTSESEDDDIPNKRAKVSASATSAKAAVQSLPDQGMDDEDDNNDGLPSGLPAGFFDNEPSSSSTEQEATKGNGHMDEDSEPENVLPAGFFDDPEQDARVRAEVGGATTDLQQKQLDAEFKALQAELAKDREDEAAAMAAERNRQEAAAQLAKGKAGASATIGEAGSQLLPTPTSTGPAEHNTIGTEIMYGVDEKSEQEQAQLELEDSILARSEEEYMLFLEMQDRIEALKSKKTLLATKTGSSSATTTLTSTTTTTSGKRKKKAGPTMLELVRAQELAKREAAKAEAEQESSSEDDEDIEAMMDWRARRV